jgi:hypothetical protein
MILPMLLKIIKMSFIPFITHSRGFGSSVRLCIQFGSVNVIIDKYGLIVLARN